MTVLKVSPSGQVYEVDLPELRLTPDAGGGYYLHGRGHFEFFEDREAALERRKELEFRGAF